MRTPEFIMQTSLIALSLLFGTVVSAPGRHGVDFIQPVTTATFECLKKAGIQFVIPRVFTSVGTVDQTGIQNVKNADAAGFSEVDGYIFPCVTSKCASAATQVNQTILALQASHARINTLWLDIERLNWPANQTANRAFIEAAVQEAEALHHRVGIYTNLNNWQEIVGLNYTAQSHLPLWWSDYNGQLGYQNYKEFGGWRQPHIHQYHGTEAGPCGVSVDLDYIQ